MPERSPSSQNVNERILVASIKVVTKTITDERNVVTITPASIKRSGVAPARPRASRYTASVATKAPVNASNGLRPFARAKKHERDHRSDRSAVRNTEQIRFGERVSQ